MPRDGWKTLLTATESIHRGGKGELDRLIVALAARQHGVVALTQLNELGLSAAGVRTRVAAGRLHRIHQGVHAVGRPDVTLDGRWMAAVRACGDGAVLSHRSAATLHGLLNARGGRIHVTVPWRTPIARAGICAHRSTCLDARDRTEVKGIPCTSVAATLLSLAAAAPTDVLESACARAEAGGVLDMGAIGELLTRRRAHPGSSRLRAVLEVDGMGLARTKSELEKRFLRLARETGLPTPTINAWMPIPGEEMQCDFVWHRERLVVEIDGWETHRTRRAFRGDRRRDRLLRRDGWNVVRVTGDDLARDAGTIVGDIRAILELQGTARNSARA
jgi:very-short-patch-repair endonuclease